MPTAQIPCPKCGSPMDKRSIHCRGCFSSGKPRIYKAPKIPHAKKPRANLPTPNWELLQENPNWIYQFVGIFHGEGSVSIHRTNQNTYIARLMFGLRQDDKAVMDSILIMLGGKVIYDPARGNSKPMLRWEFSKQSEILNILYLIRDFTLLPAKKLRDVNLVIEFCEWRQSQPFHVKDWTPALSFRERLWNIRIFKVPES